MAESLLKDRTMHGDWLGILFILAFILFCCTFMELPAKPVLSLTKEGHQSTNLKIYSSYELREIQSLCNKHPGTLNTLPGHTLERIRSLKLQRQKRRGKRAGIVREAMIPNIHQITVLTSAFHDIGNLDNILIGYCNAQSIRNKDYNLYDYMEKQKN